LISGIRSGLSHGAVSLAFLSIVTAAGFGLTGCRSAGPGPVQLESSERAVTVMERVTLAASRCWFQSGDRRFEPYRLAPELTSFSGRPRLLVVPADRPQDRPLAVIEAQGAPATLQAYGPLLSMPLGSRIATDVKRWAGGSTACAAST